MTPPSTALAAGFALAALALCAAAVDPPHPDPKPAVGFAVVELFTSEGCSSCPPADDLLASIAKDATSKGEHVYALAMHVDYWDYLGWKDPFGSAEFSKRQRGYAAVLQDGSGTYTPQMVVNGAQGFVGGDAKRARAAIMSAMKPYTPLQLEPKVSPRKASEPIRVSVLPPGAPSGAVVCFALVEDGLTTQVKEGENKGKTLKHDRVVRAFAESPIQDGKAQAELKPPADAVESSCHIVVFAQDPKTRRILGAAETPLPTTPAK